MSIAKFSVRNPVFVNLVMAGLICFGAICLFKYAAGVESAD